MVSERGFDAELWSVLCEQIGVATLAVPESYGGAGASMAEMIQLHGGIAITWEHDAHLYFKRAHSSAQLFGAPDEHMHALSVR